MTGKFTVNLASTLLALTLLNTISTGAQQPAALAAAQQTDSLAAAQQPAALAAAQQPAALAAAQQPAALSSERPVMNFQNLQHVGGKNVSLSSYEQNYIVVCFTSNSCPYSVDYEERLKQLQSKFQKDQWSAIVVAINSNDHTDDSLEEMTDRAKQQKFNFDYLKDEDQSVAKAFDAVYTPEFFVLNQKRQVIYQGALDDATTPDKVTINYVLKAIDSHRQGDKIEVAKTGARGCRIRFQRRRKK